MYSIQPEAEKQVVEWLKNRGGVAAWTNCDLSSSSVGCMMYTPATAEDGSPATSPSWQCGRKPTEIITDPSQFEVVNYVEFRKVRVRSGPPMYGGLHYKDKEKVYSAMREAGKGSCWMPDYERGYGSPWWTAVVKKLDGVRPLNMEAA